MDGRKTISRRQALAAGTAGIVGAALPIAGQSAEQAARPRVPADPTKVQGPLSTDVGGRSPFEQPKRVSLGARRTSSLTPLQDLDGIITPSDLHFERHHGGVPAIDPAQYSLLIHGLVDRPLVFTLADLRRFPGRSMIRMMECSGNGGRAYRREGNQTDVTPQQVDGLTSTSEWTGVPLATLLREAGASPKARWLLAEGMDAAVMTRSIPIEKAYDDALIAYGQNGEALRPEQGYPVRLFLPGVEGNASIKWLRRIEVADQPFMTREETSKYTDPLPDGTARIFSLDMDAKSLITEPAFPDKLTGAGWWEVRGLAWSGRGKIAKVDISVDGGKSWQPATLDEPVLPKCHTRFRFPFEWKGGETTLLSRATDDTGYTQPTLDVLLAARGPATAYHFNHIRGWKVLADGAVKFAGGA
ncbi:MAG: putative sulfite oxidase (dehydrogenase) molybdoprotein subunit [Acidobacteriota bacterium]|jgi:sulfane dehydrogenase subunit SoxC